MEIGIVGLPRSGKTTMFNAVTRGNATVAGYADKPNVGVSKVWDSRLDTLANIYKPRRVVPAEITYTDLPTPPEGFGETRGIGGQHLNFLQSVDALLVVVRGFENPAVAHVDETIDPLRDAENLLVELAFSDLTILDRRITKVEESFKGAKPQEREDLTREHTLLQQVTESLDTGVPLNEQDLSPDEVNRLAGFGLLTTKPIIIVMNIGEDQLKTAKLLEQQLHDAFLDNHVRTAVICAQLEMDLAQMDPEDEGEFRKDLGTDESSVNTMVRISYEVVGQMSFFTVGEDEVRAWEIRKGTPAQKAAGKIHTDLERGFIRAEVVTYSDLVRCGSLSEARNDGVLRHEGKEYVLKDGEIMHVLFNV